MGLGRKREAMSAFLNIRPNVCFKATDKNRTRCVFFFFFFDISPADFLSFTPEEFAALKFIQKMEKKKLHCTK